MSDDIAPASGPFNPHDPQHADKYNDPRVSVTWQGIMSLVVIVIVGAVVAVASVRARKTQLTRTIEFWGTPTVTALQLADRVHLIRRDFDESNTVELTAMPGLGHIRRALLDERHYDWNTQTDGSVAELCRQSSSPAAADPPVAAKTEARPTAASKAEKVRYVQLQFADPSGGRVPVTTIDLDLHSGFVGPADGSRRVQVNDRVRPALKHQLSLLMSFQQESYDERE